MDDLNTIVREEVEKYASGGRGLRLRTFAMLDDVHQIYAVNAVPHPKKQSAAGVVVLARIAGDVVVIEEDRTDKPLVDALMQRGIPREKIVLAYLNEKAPDVDYEAIY